MSDIMSILQASYTSAPTPQTNDKPYVAVDPKAWQGSWSGTYSDKTKFEFTISQVSGFRAQVKYVSDGTIQNTQVLIKNSSFRIGNTKFVLTGTGTAQVANAVTDAYGNTQLYKGNATVAS